MLWVRWVRGPKQERKMQVMESSVLTEELGKG